MKVLKILFKILVWILTIPFLPVKLGWRWSKGVVAQTSDGTQMPGLGRLIMTFLYSMLLYGIIFKVIGVLVGPIAVPNKDSSSNIDSNSPVPVTEQVGEQKDTTKEVNDVLLDK